MASKVKQATDALCEIMRDAGFACDADSQCWKRAECDHAQKLVRALRSGEAGKGAIYCGEHTAAEIPTILAAHPGYTLPSSHDF